MRTDVSCALAVSLVIGAVAGLMGAGDWNGYAIGGERSDFPALGKVPTSPRPHQASDWTNMNPATHPAARVNHELAYDGESDRIVLFGGRLPLPGETRSNETWSYDFNANTWTNNTLPTRPPPRDGHTMAYDSESDRIIMFGGRMAGGTFLNDTWAYDFNTATWTEMTPAVGPSSRFDAASAYDVESDRVILFGGYTSTRRNNETWAYNFNTNSWARLNPTRRPSPRFELAMAYDRESDRAVIFGGNVGDLPSNFAGDTWAYDFNTDAWDARDPVTSPSARTLTAMAYDSESDRILLFGGTDGSALRQDTWLYDFGANTWTDVSPSTSPSGRFLHAMAYDAESDAVVLFGGIATGNVDRDETWAYSLRLSAPAEPLNLFAAPGDSRIALTWQAPASNGGSPVTNYTIYRGTTAGGETLLTTVGNVLTYSDTGLTNGVTYHYQVSAVNAIGEGPRSGEVQATPRLSARAPSAPLNLQASAADARVTLSWGPPATDGGSPIANYKVYRGTTAGGETLLTTLDNVLTYSDMGLTNSQTYSYRISAVNAVGEGPQSNEAAATPLDTTNPVVAITSPTAGAKLTSVTITVTGTASDNVAVQKVEVSRDGTTWAPATGTTSWSASLTLVEGPNTIYAKATDTSGHTHAATISVTVSTPPGAYLFVAAAVAGVAAVGVGLFLLRRRRSWGEGR